MTHSIHARAGITHAFTTPIAFQIHADTTAMNDRLAGAIRDLAATNASDDELRAHQGGYYSRGGFFASGADGARELAMKVQAGVRAYIAELTSAGYAQDVDLRFQTWVGLTRRGDYQTPHVHPGANISGVYYVSVPDCPPPQGCIEFVTPIDVQEMSFLRNISHSKITIQPRAGGLLIFPSYLRHYTHPFDSDGDRVCVVFNVYVDQRRRPSPA